MKECKWCGSSDYARVEHPNGGVIHASPEVCIARLRDLAATATRAHTRAVHALAGILDYPEDERREMGAYLSQELQRSNVNV